jgi:hypothetical protein
MSPVERSSSRMLHTINLLRFTAVVFLLVNVAAGVRAQSPAPTPTPTPTPASSGISLAPARVEVEMQPGSEMTLVVNLDYHSIDDNSQPIRIVASLNDWTIDRTGQVQFERANTLPNSASSWLIYSPAETTVIPGNLHAIRVTISVPRDAAPGDHLSALIVEQRPDNLKLNQNRRQMVIRYRMAAVFYIKVPQLRRQGSLESLHAETNGEQVIITPVLKNAGNSVIRPITSLKVTNSAGVALVDLPQKESLPVLGGAELIQPLVLETHLAPGTYSVKYRVDFQDGNRPIEGITELVIQESQRTSNGPPKTGVGAVANE